MAKRKGPTARKRGSEELTVWCWRHEEPYPGGHVGLELRDTFHDFWPRARTRIGREPTRRQPGLPLARKLHDLARDCLADTIRPRYMQFGLDALSGRIASEEDGALVRGREYLVQADFAKLRVVRDEADAIAAYYQQLGRKKPRPQYDRKDFNCVTVLISALEAAGVVEPPTTTTERTIPEQFFRCLVIGHRGNSQPTPKIVQVGRYVLGVTAGKGGLRWLRRPRRRARTRR